MGKGIDERDMLILRYLLEDSRLSTRQLAKKIGMINVTVSNHIKKLVEKGYIKNFTIRIDPKKMGLKVDAFVSLKLSRRGVDISRKLLRKLVGVTSKDNRCCFYKGYIEQTEMKIILRARGPDIETLGKFAIDVVREKIMAGYRYKGELPVIMPIIDRVSFLDEEIGKASEIAALLQMTD